MRVCPHATILTWLKICVLAILVIAGQGRVFAADQSLVRISGICQVHCSGKLYVYLVDVAHFAEPNAGVQTLTREVLVLPGCHLDLAYEFLVPPGRYGLRCFLDTNANAILDKGLLGPLEPWALSWQGDVPWRFPEFKDIAFLVMEDYSPAVLVLR